MSNSYSLACFLITLLSKSDEHVTLKMTVAKLLRIILGWSEKTLSNHKHLAMAKVLKWIIVTDFFFLDNYGLREMISNIKSRNLSPSKNFSLP